MNDTPIQDQRGFIVVVLPLLLLMATAFAATAFQLRQQVKSLDISRKARQLTNRIENQLAIEIAEEERIALPKTAVPGFETAFHPNQLSPIPVVRLAPADLQYDLKSLLITLNAHPLLGPARPDFGELSRRLDEMDGHCSWDERSAVEGAAVSSSFDCKSKRTLRNPSFFIRGNLLQAHQVLFRGLNNRTLYLVTAGDLVLTAPLVVEQVRGTNLQLIALGNIQLKEIAVTDVSKTSILLHSATGAISVEAMSNVSLCANSAPLSAKVELEALGEITIGGKKMAENGKLGCDVARESEYWPKFRIVGELS